jgi:hypothetical protein
MEVLLFPCGPLVVSGLNINSSMQAAANSLLCIFPEIIFFSELIRK